MVGVLAVTLDSLLSGLATVYFEKVLKTTKLTVWDRNLQLAFYSMLIYVPWSVIDNPANPFKGWSAVTVIVALLGAIGGILVAMVIKYADGLAKNLATASRSSRRPSSGTGSSAGRCRPQSSSARSS